MRHLRHKSIIALCVILAVLYFSSDFALIDIEDTAIVVAMGIDKTQDGFEVSAQIGLPQATQQTSNNNDTIISAKGKTVMDAVELLGTQTGWHPKLAFCNLIILGKDLSTQDITTLTDNLLSSEKIQNSAMLAFSETSAKDVLTAVTPLDAISSFAIQKILLKNDRTLSTVADINVKNFALLNHGRGNWGYMPIIRIVKGSIEGQESGGAGKTSDLFDDKTLLLAKKQPDNRPIAPLLSLNDNAAVSNLSSGEGGSDSSSGSGQKKENVVFDAAYTALFSNGYLVDYLTPEETVCYNLLHSPSDQILLKSQVGDTIVMLEVFGTRKKIRLDYAVKPTIKLELKINVRFSDSTKDISGESLGRQATVPREYCAALEKELTKTLTDMTLRAYRKGVDLFDVRELTYRYYNKQFNDLKNLPLTSFVPQVDIKVSSKD